MNQVKQMIQQDIDNIGYRAYVIGLIMYDQDCSKEEATELYEAWYDNDAYTSIFEGMLEGGE